MTVCAIWLVDPWWVRFDLPVAFRASTLGRVPGVGWLGATMIVGPAS